jgi:hypothetical protein
MRWASGEVRFVVRCARRVSKRISLVLSLSKGCRMTRYALNAFLTVSEERRATGYQTKGISRYRTFFVYSRYPGSSFCKEESSKAVRMTRSRAVKREAKRV